MYRYINFLIFYPLARGLHEIQLFDHLLKAFVEEREGDFDLILLFATQPTKEWGIIIVDGI